MKIAIPTAIGLDRLGLRARVNPNAHPHDQIAGLLSRKPKLSDIQVTHPGSLGARFGRKGGK